MWSYRYCTVILSLVALLMMFFLPPVPRKCPTSRYDWITLCKYSVWKRGQQEKKETAAKRKAEAATSKTTEESKEEEEEVVEVEETAKVCVWPKCWNLVIFGSGSEKRWIWFSHTKKLDPDFRICNAILFEFVNI